MITAVDSCILIDLLSDDEVFYERSVAALRTSSVEGQLIVSDMVIAEISPLIPEAVNKFLDELSLDFVETNFEAAALAGKIFRRYLKRGGRSGRIVADFIIGAHALVSADRLLTRDNGFQRDHFKGLDVWYP